jgi:hypothetical protein
MFLAGSLAVTIAIYVAGNVSGEKGGVWSSEGWDVHVSGYLVMVKSLTF